MVELISKVTVFVTAVFKPQARKYAVAVVGVAAALVSANVLDQAVLSAVVGLFTAVGVYQVENA